MRPKTWLGVALALAAWGCEPEQRPKGSNDDVSKCLPADGQVRGLKLASEPMACAGKALAERMKGEADIYLSYGFDHAASARYTNTWSKAAAEKAVLRVDVFRMRDATAAFGAYAYQSHVLEPPVEKVELGAGARMGALSAHLWKADCYVKVETEDRSQEGRDMMRQVLAHITRRIVGDSPRPQALAKLPPTACIVDTARIFTNTASLGNVHWLADADVLSLVDGTVGAVAESFSGAALFAVLYPDQAAAAKGWTTYRKFLGGQGGTQQGPLVVASKEGGRLSAAFLRDSCVAGVWDAASAREATDLATRMLKHLGWEGPPPPKPTTAAPAAKKGDAPSTADPAAKPTP